MKTAWVIVFCSVVANAQWLNYPEAKTPRLKNGKPNLTAPAPRLNGKPDLSGVWHPTPETKEQWAKVLGPKGLDLQLDLDISSKYAINLFADLKPGEEPLRPGVWPPKDAFDDTQCLPDSLPFATFIAPMQIVQAREQLTVIYESNNPARQIYLDGRPLPKDPQPAYLGYSTAKWSGDTLVSEASGFTVGRLDGMEHPRSESARLIERFHRRDFGHMDMEVTVDDPVNYTRPFSVKLTLLLDPDSDVNEYVCVENERDRGHIHP